MSEKYLKMCGLEKGQKVLYPHYVPYVVMVDVVTVKDVRPLWEGEDESELVLYVEEFDWYINPLYVYTEEVIHKMLNKEGG